ncbi:plasmid mobilization protein [Clostridium cochlearium]|uniref:plasmid mobilization protein n=1 Tax=Clostridium cochlearium TaxID=1494 RepID=UPI00241C7791|nr:hypothetical protein [Clostridium cochlearium]MBE6065912.1 hypothetical protein [Clostridium cochlearium]
MSKLKKDKVPIIFRLTLEERELLRKKIKNSPLNQQEYLRFCSLSKNIIIYDFKTMCQFDNDIYEIKRGIKTCLDKLDVGDKDIIKDLSKIEKKADEICLILSDYLSKLQ